MLSISIAEECIYIKCNYQKQSVFMETRFYMYCSAFQNFETERQLRHGSTASDKCWGEKAWVQGYLWVQVGCLLKLIVECGMLKPAKLVG